MSKRGSIKYQIQKTVLQNTVPEMSEKHIKSNKIPTGRFEAKQNNINPNKYIFSYGDLKRVMQTINRVCKYNDIKDIQDITTEDCNKYIENLIQKDRSPNYIMTEKYSIRKFDSCMLNTGKRSKHDSAVEVTVETPPTEDRKRGGRFTNDETKDVLKYIAKYKSKEKYTIAKLQDISGLRSSEAVNLKARNINVENNTIIMTKDDNMPKGGRARTVKLDNKFNAMLRKIKGNKKGETRLFSTSKRTLENTVKEACDYLEIVSRGPHGFRGAFAYRRLKIELQKRGIKPTDYRIQKIVEKHGNALLDKEKAALQAVTYDLGHNRIRVVREDYLTR